jgi:4-amino-4-deoxy-L-arabinose transferase-like glycosyltransferase
MLLVVVACGAALRFYRLGELPPGLYQDEAYNGLDALEVIQGTRPLYFAANNGREPLFIYLQSLSVEAFGRTALALRLPAAVVGTLLIPAAYGLGRALFGPRVGLLAAAITATNWWALALSRIGLRAITLPLIVSLSLACAAAGWRSRRPWLVALGGALYGLAFYTYLSARFTPLALLAFLIFWYSARRPTFPPARWSQFPFRGLILFFVSAAVVAAPLAGFALGHPDIVMGRVEQVSILSRAVNGGDLGGTFFHNLLAALGMFVWRGDLNARHNLPGRPVFDPLLGAAFVVGALLCVRRVVRRPQEGSAALALAWCGVMLAPTVLSKDAPHYLRAVGVLPMLYLFPALALEVLWSARVRWRGWPVNRAVTAVVVAGGFILTARDYFGPYARDPNTAFAFQSAASDLAAQINDYLSAEAEEGSQDQRLVYLDRRLWDAFPSVRFLTLGRPALRVFDSGEPPALSRTADTRVIVWPYEDVRPVLRSLPENVLIEAEAGPPYRGDQEPVPYALFTTYAVRPAPGLGRAPLAEFERGIILQSASVTPIPAGLRVELVWVAQPGVWQPAGEAYHVFVHLMEGETLIAQHDSPPAQGLYPTAWWRGGDWVMDTHLLPLPADGPHAGLSVRVGLYAFPSGERLKLNGTVDEYVELPAD